MIYDNQTIRRQDRLLPQAEAEELLQKGEYGVLSMVDESGKPYGIPVNYVWDGTDILYIHCAPEGRKLRSIAAHPEISFCVAGHTRVAPDKFTTAYESVVLTGTASTGLPEEERRKALELLIEKYSSDFKETGLKYAEKSFHRTEIIRLKIDRWSGKCKRVTFSAK